MTSHLYVPLLKASPYFSICPANILGALSAVLRTECFAAGEFICRQGEVGMHIFILQSGAAKVLFNNSASDKHSSAATEEKELRADNHDSGTLQAIDDNSSWLDHAQPPRASGSDDTTFHTSESTLPGSVPAKLQSSFSNCNSHPQVNLTSGALFGEISFFLAQKTSASVQFVLHKRVLNSVVSHLTAPFFLTQGIRILPRACAFSW